MTSSPESVRRAYDASWPIIESVQKYVSKTLKAFCGERYIFRDRIKSLASLSEKLETGRFGKWSELDDLYACTIVVSIASSEQQVLEYLRSAFVEIRVRGRSDTKKDPGVFRFDGLRWYGKIRPEVADQMLPGVASFIFEVQVLTAFEYAWSQVNHFLVYKADEVDWKRERLSAQLKSAVEQIEMIIASFDATSSLVPESPWPAYDSMKLIISKFKQWMIAGKISETLEPASWKRFAENIYGIVKQIDGEATDQAVRDLLSSVEVELDSVCAISQPTSGTLFQYVLAVVARGGKLNKVKRSYIVHSSELRDVHGVSNVLKPFQFDGVWHPSDLEP